MNWKRVAKIVFNILLFPIVFLLAIHLLDVWAMIADLIRVTLV